MFTEKKVSGKYDGEVKLMRGDGLHAVNQGGAGRPTQWERKRQAVAVLWGEWWLPATFNPPCGPDPSSGNGPQLYQPLWSPAQMEFTSICLKEARCTDPRLLPQALLQKPQRAWLGLSSSSDVLTKGPGLSQAPQV